jgi:hypothetical protein
MDQQTDAPNVQTFTAIGGAEVDRYYGCWLDTNLPFNPVLPANVPTSNPDGPFTDPNNPPLSIQQAIIRNPHQCLIAEVAFDPVQFLWVRIRATGISWHSGILRGATSDPGARLTRSTCDRHLQH